MSKEGERKARVRGNCQNNCVVSGKTGGSYSPAFKVAGAPEFEGFQCTHTVRGEH